MCSSDLEDLKAVNTEANPLNVMPKNGNLSKVENGVLISVLEKQSWNVIQLRK